MLSGGALYNNLDYSFTVGYEDGTFEVKDPTRVAESEFRRQIGLMKRFLKALIYSPETGAGSSLSADSGLNLFALEQTGKEYLLYSRQMPVSVTLKVPSAPMSLDAQYDHGCREAPEGRIKGRKTGASGSGRITPEVAISLRHSENN